MRLQHRDRTKEGLHREYKHNAKAIKAIIGEILERMKSGITTTPIFNHFNSKELANRYRDPETFLAPAMHEKYGKQSAFYILKVQSNMRIMSSERRHKKLKEMLDWRWEHSQHVHSYGRYVVKIYPANIFATSMRLPT